MPHRCKIEIKASKLPCCDTLVKELRSRTESENLDPASIRIMGHTRSMNRRWRMPTGSFAVSIIGWEDPKRMSLLRRIRAAECSAKRNWQRLWKLPVLPSADGSQTDGWRIAPFRLRHMATTVIRPMRNIRCWNNSDKTNKITLHATGVAHVVRPPPRSKHPHCTRSRNMTPTKSRRKSPSTASKWWIVTVRIGYRTTPTI